MTVTVSSTKRAPLQAACARLDVAVLDVNVRAHRLQAGDVNVDRARADRAAARQRHIGASQSARAAGPSTRIDARMVFTSW